MLGIIVIIVIVVDVITDNKWHSDVTRSENDESVSIYVL